MMWAVLVGAGCQFSAPAREPPVDAKVEPTDAPADTGGGGGQACYGASGVWQVCLAARPTGAVVLPATLDADRDARCLKAQPTGWLEAGQPNACFIVGDTIAIDGGKTTTVTGSRPLVLVAHAQLSVAGLLDYAAHEGAPGAPRAAAECKAPGREPLGVSNGGSGGGAGASFLSRGGAGGLGKDMQGDDVQAGESALADAVPARLRVGCAGQEGAAKSLGDLGKGGGGGGALYLIAGTKITIIGAINASGGGATGGKRGSGGSGGGSGGMIVLHSAAIDASGAIVIATGGGGAGGGTNTLSGADGSDPNLIAPLQGAFGGNNGGRGFPALDVEVAAHDGAFNGQGGGGGGGGAGYVRSNRSLGVAAVSPGVDVVP